MASYRIKRIYDEPNKNDGYRVLIDRLWPRGISKERARIDEWAKDIAPSTELRKYFDHQPSRFETFRNRYLIELESNDDAMKFKERTQSHKNVTLLYGAKDPQCNHAVVLLEWLQ